MIQKSSQLVVRGVSRWHEWNKMLSAMKTFVLLLSLLTLGSAQTYKPAESNLKARRWFQDSKFGLFIHWGVYSVLGDGEWVMNNKKMTIAEYEPLAQRFNPTDFDAAAWVSLAKAAGMKYISITSKHHDGFAMWATKQGKWNIADATPYKKDPLKMLADECRKQGLKLFFYHSHLDWHHPDYFPRGRTGQSSGRPDSGDFNRYLDYMDNQLRELLTNYGDIAGIWFDGWWDKPTADWRLQKTYSLIHSLQPAALVGNNHHRKPFDGEDFQMFEKDLPGQNTAGFNAESEIGKLPLESCDTINKAWGYNSSDKQFKSVKDLVHFLARAAGQNTNFLLNVGPMPNGKIQPEFIERLRGMGEWMKVNGDSIYGTRGGPLRPQAWGAMTQKPGKIYVHVLDTGDTSLSLSGLPKVIRAKALASGAPVEVTQANGGIVLRLPEKRDPSDTVIVLDTGK
jgi:alpha-L-fucosidase